MFSALHKELPGSLRCRAHGKRDAETSTILSMPALSWDGKGVRRVCLLCPPEGPQKDVQHFWDEQGKRSGRNCSLPIVEEKGFPALPRHQTTVSCKTGVQGCIPQDNPSLPWDCQQKKEGRSLPQQQHSVVCRSSSHTGVWEN